MHSAERPIRADDTSPAGKNTAEQPLDATEHIVLRLLVEMHRELAAMREELSEARQDIAEMKARHAARRVKRPKSASHDLCEEGRNKQAFDVADIPYYWSIPATQVKELLERGELPEALFSQKSKIVMRQDIVRAIRSRLTVPENGHVTAEAKRHNRRDSVGELTSQQCSDMDAAEDVFKAFEEYL